jgi:phosphopantethiene--protein transferase domain
MEIGIDSVEIERIKKIYLKEGNKFLERIYSNKEKEELLLLKESNSSRLYTKLAGKYAVKEAVYKAVRKY